MGICKTLREDFMGSTLEQVKNGDFTKTVCFRCLVLIGSVLEILLKYFFWGLLMGTTGDFLHNLTFFVIIECLAKTKMRS